jgi:hypothetical protein
MTRLRRLAPPLRLLMAAALALCAGVWLAAPPGFMPAMENGAPAIVPCPGSDGTGDIIEGIDETMPAMPGMPMGDSRHNHDRGQHPSCEYSVAATMLAMGAAATPVVVTPPAVSLPPAAPRLPAFRSRATRERPPAQGPPALA